MAKKANAETAETNQPVTFGGALEERPQWEDVPETEEVAETMEAKATNETEAPTETESAAPDTDEATEEETSEEEAEVTEQAKPVEEVATKEAAKPAAQTQAPVTPEPKTVPLEALLSERKKRQEAEAKVAQYENGGQTPADSTWQDPHAQPTTAAIKEVETSFKNKLTKVSINAARRVHKDFDEKLQAVVDLSQSDPRVLDWIDGQEDPGQAAYEYGEEIIYQRKYGTTRQEQHENLKKELTESLTKEITAKVEAEYLAKLRKKNGNPTNISNARAAGGNGSAEYRSKTFGERL